MTNTLSGSQPQVLQHEGCTYLGSMPFDGTAHGIHRAVYKKLGVAAANVLFDFRSLGGAHLRFAGIARDKGTGLPEGFVGGRMMVRIRPLMSRGKSELCATTPDGALDVARPLFEKNGAVLTVASLPAIEKMRYRDAGNGSFPFYTAIIDGQVQVTDREKFQRAYAYGLGRGKTFGCGMIVLL